MWNFSTEPEFQKKLDWMRRFVAEEVEPINLVFDKPGHPYDVTDKVALSIIKPLQEEVKRQNLWACHLDKELGGHGYGQLKLALMNEILGGSSWAPRIFGTQAPDTGNAEILARFGTPEQKKSYLQPLLDGEIVSCFSMTEPQGGSDPRVFETRAVRNGDGWVLDGYKWFSSQAKWASFFIVMAITDPDAKPSKRFSMFLVPAGTPGVQIVRNVGTIGHDSEEATHAYMHYGDVHLGADAMLGEEGGAFAVAQARLGGGRIHHAMRTVGVCNKAYDMMCERALSRSTQGTTLAEKHNIQSYISNSYVELQQFRLLVLHAAWTIDQCDREASRRAIAAVKIATPRVYHDVVQRAIQVHGSLGVSNEMPLGNMWIHVATIGILDGPTEAHQANLARMLLRDHAPASGLFPSQHIPPRREAALKKLAKQMERAAQELS